MAKRRNPANFYQVEVVYENKGRPDFPFEHQLADLIGREADDTKTEYGERTLCWNYWEKPNAKVGADALTNQERLISVSLHDFSQYKIVATKRYKTSGGAP